MDYLSGIPLVASATDSILSLSFEAMGLIVLFGVVLVYFLYAGKSHAVSFPLAILLTALLWLAVPYTDTLDALGSSAKEAFWYQETMFLIVALILHWRLARLIFIEYPSGIFRKGIEALLLSGIAAGALIITALVLFVGDYMPLSGALMPFFTSEMALSAWSAAFFAILLLVSV